MFDPSRCGQAKSYSQASQLTTSRCNNYMFPVYLCVYQVRLKLLSEIDAVTLLGFYRLCLAQWIERGNPCRCQSCPGHGPKDESNHSEKVSGSISDNNLIQVWCVKEIVGAVYWQSFILIHLSRQILGLLPPPPVIFQKNRQQCFGKDYSRRSCSIFQSDLTIFFFFSICISIAGTLATKGIFLHFGC